MEGAKGGSSGCGYRGLDAPSGGPTRHATGAAELAATPLSTAAGDSRNHPLDPSYSSGGTGVGHSDDFGNNYMDASDTKYEAKSAKDGSWYDAEGIVDRRMSETGRLELLVHFSGFEVEKAEWIDARTCLRPRSVPYKATECANVHCWDPVLCYKVSEQGGLYFDAEVHAIQRGKTHKPGEECDCKILVLYVHDNSEDIVSLRKLRRRYVGPDYKPQTKYELPPQGKK